MSILAERHMAHIGETQAVANHDHDMIHELSKRIDGVWRYDQYIANAGDDEALCAFWSDLKDQEEINVRRLKQLIADHISKGCF